MIVRYRGGGTAVCEMSRANRPRTFGYRDVFVQGTRGALRLPWDAEQGIAFTEGGTSLLPGNGQVGFDREVARLGRGDPRRGRARGHRRRSAAAPSRWPSPARSRCARARSIDTL